MKKFPKHVRSRLTKAAIAVGVLMNGVAARGDDPTRERQVEAAFIYNFTQFIEWPKDAFGVDTAPFVIGVLGRDPFDGLLARAMAGKKVGSHSVQVVYFRIAADVSAVNLLYVPTSEDEHAGDVVARLSDSPMLTIGQSEFFLAANGGIRLYTEDRRMRFQINLRATDRARLKISSKLLNLAKIYGK